MVFEGRASTRSIVDPSLAMTGPLSILVIEGRSSRMLDLQASRAITIGRGEGVDVAVADDAVSRKHVEVAVDAEGGVGNGSPEPQRDEAEWRVA